jgi:hypothetical protein
MPLTSVLSERVRPKQVRRYEELVQQLAKRAVQRKEAWHWTAHQTVFGEVDRFHYVSEAPDFAALGARGRADDLVRRLMGEKEGNEWLREANEGVESVRHTVSMERPDLSYPPERRARPFPAAVVTLLRARPGGREACEELIRKVAEAIPKAGDPARLVAYQTLIGDLSTYWTVRPLQDLGELDRQLQPADLLTRAFGAAEGGLIFRTGTEAIEEVRREIVLHREDLSNPG